MNKSTSQKTGGCKAAKLQTVKTIPQAEREFCLTLPATVFPLLQACAASVELSPREYVRRSIFAAVRCDADDFRQAAFETLEKIEGGQI